MSHRDIPYRDLEVSYHGAAVAPVWAADGRSFDVPSECPACAGQMTKNVPRGLPSGSKGLFGRPKEQQPAPPERLTLICECGYPHASRPAESTETGCGACWKVPLA